MPLVERVTGLLHKISALAFSLYSLKGPWTTPALPMSHKCMQVPAMTFRTTCDKHFFFLSLQGLPLMCLLYRAPKKLNKTWFLWSELTNLVLAQEPQSTSFVDPTKSMYLGSCPTPSAYTLSWPLMAPQSRLCTSSRTHELNFFISLSLVVPWLDTSRLQDFT